MNQHKNMELFKEAVTITAQQMNIPEIYVEKDYWVTLSLYAIFNNDIGKETVFKGGTALSKCFGIIKRFSEDIDLVVLRREVESGNQLKKKLKKIDFITAMQSSDLSEKQVENIFKKMLNAKPLWLKFIDSSFISNDYKSSYKELIETRFVRIT